MQGAFVALERSELVHLVYLLSRVDVPNPDAPELLGTICETVLLGKLERALQHATRPRRLPCLCGKWPIPPKPDCVACDGTGWLKHTEEVVV